MRKILAIAAVSFVGACATGGESSYRAELERLEQSCMARDGILRPSAAPGQTGRPALDYVCEIHGPSRIDPRG